jgi:glycosyltransferase involved in cell wall biosynthesis
MKILIVSSLASSLINFRGHLIAALQANGLNVHVAAPNLGPHHPIRLQLQGMGVTVHQVPLSGSGMAPLVELRAILALLRLMRRITPDIVFSYTIKPIIYGTLTAWLVRVPQRVALITGLGYAFQITREPSLLLRAVRCAYGLALAQAHLVFFQNKDDLALSREVGILSARTLAFVVNGSGVDLVKFPFQPLPHSAFTGALRFLFIGRLLVDKGVREYVAAAEMLKHTNPKVKCAMVGLLDDNPSSISQEELDAWIADNNVEYLGGLEDVRPALEQCSVLVLPSYREGVPRAVLEAMATGRAIITTDAPGCRETVTNGDNGFLVPVQDSKALAAAMRNLIDQPTLLGTMGKRSRRIAEQKFDVHEVNTFMLKKMGLI